MSVLDEIYGNAAGHEKVASADANIAMLANMSAFDYVQQLDDADFEKVASVIDPEADLSQVSALELVEYLVDLEEGPEKLAGLEGVDLSQIPAEELAAFIAEQEYEQEKLAETQLVQQMIDDGDFGRADMAGRIMARAQVDELQKLASAEDEWPDEIDLEGLSGADLEEILATGEYDLVKEAAFYGPMRRQTGLIARLRGTAGKLTAAQRDELRAQMKRQSMASPDRGASAKARYEYDQNRRSGGRTMRGMGIEAGMRTRQAMQWARENPGKAAALGITGVGVPAAGAGTAYALRRKKKNRS